ncbi:MAG: hypothetical protein ACLFQJ_09440 [Campylobacterales bacterium]
MYLFELKDLETIEQLRALNNRLSSLQNKYLKEAIVLDKALIKRVEDKEDILEDYELEIQVCFYLKEDHSNYKEDEDNIITTLVEYEKKISKNQERYNWLYKNNHNEYTGRPNCPISKEYHCWWYHCLYDHNDLTVEELLSIGTIWCDIKVAYQYLNQ